MLEKVLSYGKIGILPIRGPMSFPFRDRGLELKYTTSTIERDGIFDFTIAEKIALIAEPQRTIYEAQFRGRLLPEDPVDDPRDLEEEIATGQATLFDTTI